MAVALRPSLADRRDDSDLESRVAALERRVRALEAGKMRRTIADPRLGRLLQLIYLFSGSRPWTVSELLNEARRGAGELWWALDELAGNGGNPANRLGRWLQRHEGVEATGLRLVRVIRKSGTWLYAVERWESWESGA